MFAKYLQYFFYMVFLRYYKGGDFDGVIRRNKGCGQNSAAGG